MPPPYISALVFIIAVLVGWIGTSRFSKTMLYQEDSITHGEHKYQKGNGDLDLDTKVAIEYLDEVSRNLGTIKTIHMTMGLEQKSLEKMIGEILITDNFHRLELIHDAEASEGHVFKQVFLQSIPELMEELADGLTTEIWDLTETVIDDLRIYSKKLVGYGEHMKVGLENAKVNWKFNNTDFEVTKKLVVIAGGLKCVFTEWKKINEIMDKYLEWVGKGLGLKANVVSDKKKILSEILKYSYLAETFADIHVNYLGITSLNSNHSTWLEQGRGEQTVPIVFDIVSDQEESKKIQEIENLFLAIGLTIEFYLHPKHYRVEYSRRYEVPSSKGTYGALKMVS